METDYFTLQADCLLDEECCLHVVTDYRHLDYLSRATESNRRVPLTATCGDIAP